MEWIWRALCFFLGMGFLLCWIGIFKIGSDSDLRLEIARLRRELADEESRLAMLRCFGVGRRTHKGDRI